MKYVIFILTTLLSIKCLADESSDDVSVAQEKLRATFSNLKVRSFKPGPIDGLYEMDLGSGIAYFYPEKQLLFFGEIYNKDGVSLTAKSLEQRNVELVDQLSMDDALVLGPEGAPKLIEFTDPNCGYCRAFNEWIEKEGIPARRYIFFDTKNRRDSLKKAVHVLCSKDKEVAFKNVFTSFKGELKSCEKGLALAAKQQKASETMGVSGTPSFVLGGTLIQGFRKTVIHDYLSRELRLSKIGN